MAETGRQPRILLVEGESSAYLNEARVLSEAGYEIELARDGEAASALALSDSGFDLVLMDIGLAEGLDCGEAARRIGAGGGPPVAFLFARSEEEALARTRNSGGLGLIARDLGEGALLASVRLALDHASALRALAESDRRYRLLAENVGDVIWTYDPASLRFTYISPSIVGLRGLSVEEALAEPLEKSLSPSSLAKVQAGLAAIASQAASLDAAAAPMTDLYEQPCKGGGMKWVEITTRPVLDAEGGLIEVVGVSRDATARVLAEADLQNALADKDKLYKALQHRVKNSIALIVSLLSLKSDSLEDESARAILDEAQVRVRTIGLLYEQLYRSRSIGDIDLGAYLSEVARVIVESPICRRGLRLELDCGSMSIDVDRAVSAGLLLAELVSNCAKHAFHERKSGRIRLSLSGGGADVRLLLEDDGVGLPAGFNPSEEKSLGFILITQLAKQLGGLIVAGPGLEGQGAGFSVRFPV